MIIKIVIQSNTHGKEGKSSTTNDLQHKLEGYILLANNADMIKKIRTNDINKIQKDIKHFIEK